MAAVKKALRLVTEEDSSALLEIYTPYINSSAVTFECEVPPVGEFCERIRSISGNYPWLVCEINGCIAGYAYAAKFHERAAYQWSVTLSVYVKDGYRRKGLARAMYATLFEVLELLGYFNAFACITHPNAESEGFHKSLGFMPVGIFHSAGYKLGEWHDVIWYELSLKKPAEGPPGPLPIKEADQAVLQAILHKGRDLIKER